MSDINLVTIAIASFNNDLYIERCIESVINQTYSNLEILIVDDGSKDNTLEIISKYQKDNRVVIIEKENGGLSSVRQRSLDEATGDYICFIDADDYLDPHYVECMLTKLIKDRTDICVCSTKFIDSNGNYLSEQTKSFLCENSKEPYRTTASEFSVPNNSKISQLHLSDSWNKMYKVVTLKKSGVSFCMPKGFNGTDTVFNRLIALHGLYYSSVANELYIHVIYSSSAVHRKKKNLLFSYQFIAERCVEESVKLGIYNQLKNYLIIIYHKNLLEALIDEYRENSGFSSRLKRFRELRREHLFFSKRVDIHFLETTMNEDLKTKLFISLFRCSIVLVLIIFMGRRTSKRI